MNREYKDGDIIIATVAPPASGLLFHRGIVFHLKNKKGEVVPHVFHNTPMKLNPHGGTVVLETLKQFENDGREIVQVHPSNLTLEKVIQKNEVIKKRKFDWADFNCEHYVTFCTKGEMKSVQLHKYLFLTAAGVLTFFTVRLVQKLNKK